MAERVPKAEDLVLEAADKSWRLHHPAERLEAPGQLVVDAEIAWHGARCRLGDLSDELALVERVRGTRKGQTLLVHAEGYLPFGTQPAFRHTSRCSDGLLRVTTDLRLRPRTLLRQQIEIGSLELTSDLRRWRALETDAQGLPHLGEWQRLEAPFAWPEPPLALVFERADGCQIEVGHGSDLWRWQDGLKVAPGSARWELAPDGENGGWQLRRIVARIVEPVEAPVLEYRFTWYAAWRPAALATQRLLPEPDLVLPWQAPGKLSTAALEALRDGSVAVLDLAATEWPEELCHSHGARPCLSSRGATKRLRHAIRQLDSLHDRHFQLILRGISPALCRRSNHLSGRGERLHWDINALIDFVGWCQHVLGPERPVLVDTGQLELPSLINLSDQHRAAFANEDGSVDEFSD